jgi:hypothetical protein
MKKAPIVEVNMPTQMTADSLIYDGNFNALPADVYRMLDATQKEEEDLTGISNLSIGSFEARNMNTTATGSSIMASMSQKRLMYIVRHISDMMESVFKKWSLLNADLITEVSVKTPSGEQVTIVGDELPVDGFGLTIRTPTQGLKEKRMMDLTSMLQAIAPMSAVLGSEPAMNIIMQMATELDMPTLKVTLSEAYQQSKQGNPMAEQSMQLEMQEKQAEIAKDVAQAGKYSAETDAKRVETMLAYNGLEKIG